MTPSVPHLAHGGEKILQIAGPDAGGQLHAENGAGVPLLGAQAAQGLPVDDDGGDTERGCHLLEVSLGSPATSHIPSSPHRALLPVERTLAVAKAAPGKDEGVTGGGLGRIKGDLGGFQEDLGGIWENFGGTWCVLGDSVGFRGILGGFWG